MATFTTNYNLRKPATSDFVTVTSDINASMDTIDAEIKQREDEVVALDTRVDALESQNAYHAAAISGSAQSIPDSTATAVNLDTLDFESSAGFGDTASDQLVIPKTGVYVISVYASFDSNATGRRDLFLKINGSNVAIYREINNSGSLGTYMHINYIDDLTAADTLSLSVSQTSGGNLSLATARLSAAMVRSVS